MDKLIELLNESTNGRFKSEQDLRLCIEMRWYCRDFIKRLVDNDKIDLLRLDNRIALSDFNKCERVLMALSISSSPIEDLISYLK